MAKKLISKPPPNIKLKPLMIKTIFSDLKINYRFLYITQWEYCQTLDFRASPNTKLKTLI